MAMFWAKERDNITGSWEQIPTTPSPICSSSSAIAAPYYILQATKVDVNYLFIF